MFPDEASARAWFESRIWRNGRVCGHCGSKRTSEATHRSMPYRCKDCRSYFSVRTGTVLECSKISLRKWVYAIYLHVTSLKGISSMKLHRDIGVSQPAAWFMLQRIRQWCDDDDGPFSGPVEADETFFGGKAKNMHAEQREQLTGRGAADKTAVVGVKDRATGKVSATVVASTDAATLVPFVETRTDAEATVYTDGHKAYNALSRTHEVVEHSVGEYVRGQAHTNGIESFWAMLKRGYHGTFHKISPKHLHRYVAEFAGRHNIRNSDTMAQMDRIAQGFVGKRLTYAALTAGVLGTGAEQDRSEPW